TQMRRDVELALSQGSYDLVVCDARHSGIHDLIEARPVPRKITQLWSGAGRDEPISQLFLRRLREERVIDHSIGQPSAQLFFRPEERRLAAAMWSQLGVIEEQTIVLNVHSGVAVKRWPAERFVTIGRRLTEDGWTIAVLAGDAPRAAWEIAEAIPAARFVPKVGLRQSAACLANTALVVSGDSGLAHLANAVGAPVLAIFGPTWAGRYGVGSPSVNLGSPFECPERNPLNFTTQRCWYTGRCIFTGKATCCEDVTSDEVLAAARNLLGRNAAGSLPGSTREGDGA
ncbi:MAG: glycosyltransferase family 9 protein, partial [Chloroflexota bacterium]